MTIDPELPWGCWMRIEQRGLAAVYVDDATGATWPTIRTAFWIGRLGMPEYNREPPADQLERIHAVLAATLRRTPTFREQEADLFEGSGSYLRMFHLWLASSGLVVLAENGHGATALTDEGRAVLLMLSATRPHDVRRSRPSAATIGMLAELGMGPEDKAERFNRLEREAARWDAAFLRRDEAGRPAVILSRRANAPMPVHQTVWTLSFQTDRQRDRFYDWLCLRLDRWQDWADLVGGFGAQKLTHHLLAVMAASLEDEATSIDGRQLSLPPTADR
ncbi:hypothetical protein [Sphingomonas fuzhouensis]|uniref:hypothetical protein n=1 Tax=Sphingomonas fuzhouensis TaxID=3106033 RepID=UPI002AFDFBCD|nr:hypothetical protein [Sphingomonas sp. SGZ-02]